MRSWVVPVLAVGACLAAAGCTDAPDRADPSPRPSVTAAEPAVRDCGTLDVGLMAQPSQEALGCLVDVRADGTVEVTTDTRQDRYGAQRLTQRVCTGAQIVKEWIAFASCRPA
jgi:hypothetical protein